MISEKSLSFENSGVLKGLFCVVAAQFFFTTQPEAGKQPM